MYLVVIFNVVLQPGTDCNSGSLAGMAPEKKYDFDPYDGMPGETWDLRAADELLHRRDG